jgi:hypothetical protein
MSSGNASGPNNAEVSTTPTGAGAKKSSFGVARIILLVVLLGAVAVLAWDYMARSKFNAAQEVATEISDKPAATPDVVHEEMGRDPDSTETGEDGRTMSDFYNFSTAFYVYSIQFKYRAIGRDADTKWTFTEFVVDTQPRFW